jgi:hypothetical protein
MTRVPSLGTTTPQTLPLLRLVEACVMSIADVVV